MKPGEGDMCYASGSEGAIKTAHTYKLGCQKYAQGGTEEILRKAACGGQTRELLKSQGMETEDVEKQRKGSASKRKTSTEDVEKQGRQGKNHKDLQFNDNLSSTSSTAQVHADNKQGENETEEARQRDEVKEDADSPDIVQEILQ